MIFRVQGSVMPPSVTGTHGECREAVCVCCGVKTPKKKITNAEEKLVQKFAKPEYDSEVMSFPAGLCSLCRYMITKPPNYNIL